MAQDLNRHLDEGELEKYSMADLREEEAAGFQQHLLNCEQCQQRLAETDAYVAAMRRAAAQLRNRQGLHAGAAEGPRRHWLRLIPAVASVALLVIAIGWWSWNSDLTGSLPFALSLEATGGSGIAAYAPADTWLLVRLDLAGLPTPASYRLEMVDAGGAVIWQAFTTARDAKAESKIPGTRAGVYFIRVYSRAGELLREFGLKIRPRE